MPYNPVSMGNGGTINLSPGYTYDSNGDIVMQGGTPSMQNDANNDYAGMPNMPYYNPIFNPQTESMLPGMEQQLAEINTNPLNMSVQNFSDLANRQGPSAWATQAGQQQNQLAANALENGATQTNAQTAQALGTLGNSGGLTSGARERAAEGGAKNYMNMSQDTSRQNALNQMQIGTNDQQNKMQEMGMLPGMEAQALQPQFQKANMWGQALGTDIQNQINSNQYANQWNQGLYNTRMQGWGAEQQANATMNSGK